MKFLTSILCLALALSQSSCIKSPFAVDAAPAPTDVRDLSVIFSGCGNRATVGYAFCRVQEGSNPKDRIVRIILPTETCSDGKETCASLLFLRRDGSENFRVGIPRKSKSIDIALSRIIESEAPFTIADHDGEYQVLVRLEWKDEKANVERTARADGLVRVWVTNDKAQILGCQDPQGGWREPVAENCNAEFSTKLRATVCGKGC